MKDIKFGTDGWRAIIADDFVFDNVRKVVGAIASYVLKKEDARQGVIVGYDTRFASNTAARIAAEVLSNAGIPVLLTSNDTPTPAISFAVKSLGAAGGVVITSSHNPWNWNGVSSRPSSAARLRRTSCKASTGTSVGGVLTPSGGRGLISNQSM